MIVLALNGGSSTLKFAAFRIDGEAETCLVRATIPAADPKVALLAAFDALRAANVTRVDAVGHRVVHGGAKYDAPAVVDAQVRAALVDLVPFAPLHLPSEIAILDAAAERFPGVPQVACFDTAFHRTLPEVAERFAIPRRFFDDGVRRYGFHGLSYQYVVETIGARALGRAVIAHLGNGASMAAVKGGVSIDTTMGMTPTGGIVMGTRCGDLDPGVLLYLQRRYALDADAIDDVVNRQSGLLGVSGQTSDMRNLLDLRRGGDERARAALAIFVYSARKSIGALAAALGGLDTLVFTGGIGEHAAEVRAEIAAELGFLGVSVDAERNARSDAIVSPDGAACVVRVVPTDEERIVARSTARLASRAQ
jgi:acetate kinase